ncbi:MAG: hypothetical protein JXR60_12295 [Bacteroidales bacterium]|nr:hypothetical protein [Bacteroidales bacterium]
MAREDILTDDNNELQIVNGDFSIGVSDNQHVDTIFKAQKGEIRSSPHLGFGVIRYIKKTVNKFRVFLRNLKVELEKDGYKEVDIKINQESGELEIDLE